MKKIVAVYLCMISIILCACSKSSTNVIAPDACDSPEKAIETFITAIKGGDLNAIRASFAIQDYIDGYDQDSEYAKQIPKPTFEERAGKVTEHVYTFLLGFNMIFEEESNMEDLLNIEKESLTDPKQYESLQIVRIDLPETDEELHKKNISSQEYLVTKLYQADSRDYRTALLSLDGKTYYCGFNFAVFDGKYEIYDFTCPLVSIDYRLALFPCTEEEYLQLIES